MAIKSAIEDADIFADPSDNWNNLATLRGAMGSLARDVVALQLEMNLLLLSTARHLQPS